MDNITHNTKFNKKLKFDLEIEKIIKTINEEKARRKARKKLVILLQFPDGLRPVAKDIAKKIEEKTNTTCVIWLGSCFGACDVPTIHKIPTIYKIPTTHKVPNIFGRKRNIHIDLVFCFGHTLWPFTKKIKAKEL